MCGPKLGCFRLGVVDYFEDEELKNVFWFLFNLIKLVEQIMT